jgi:putative endonuclease
MDSYFVYILQSDKNRHYIGYTSNLPQRLAQHNRKHKGFTGTTEKWELLLSCEMPDKSRAMRLEKYLKSMKNYSKAVEYLKEKMVQSTPTKSEEPVPMNL